jgi:hypothetical protein
MLPLNKLLHPSLQNQIERAAPVARAAVAPVVTVAVGSGASAPARVPAAEPEAPAALATPAPEPEAPAERTPETITSDDVGSLEAAVPGLADAEPATMADAFDYSDSDPKP